MIPLGVGVQTPQDNSAPLFSVLHGCRNGDSILESVGREENTKDLQSRRSSLIEPHTI